MERVNRFLDSYVLPWPVKFLTNRFIILVTIALLIPLIVYKEHQVLVLLLNSYLNTMSVAVSSIVLLYATITEIRDKQIAEMQERRAQEDHQHVVEMHQLVLDNMAFQHEEIQDLKEILAQLQGRSYTRVQFRPEQHRDKSPDLRALHPGGKERFEKNHVRRRVSASVQGAKEAEDAGRE